MYPKDCSVFRMLVIVPLEMSSSLESWVSVHSGRETVNACSVRIVLETEPREESCFSLGEPSAPAVSLLIEVPPLLIHTFHSFRLYDDFVKKATGFFHDVPIFYKVLLKNKGINAESLIGILYKKTKTFLSNSEVDIQVFDNYNFNMRVANEYVYSSI